MNSSTDADPPLAPPGWYPDPSRVNAWRWFDGTTWTGIGANGTAHRPGAPLPKLLQPWPRSRSDWIACAAAGIVGLAIWIPTMAMQPRVSYGHPSHSAASPWYLPLMFVAPLALGALLPRHWPVVATGLLVPQFLLAPWTTPRGDNDGLWTLIVVELLFLFVVAHLVAALSGGTVNRVRTRRQGRRDQSESPLPPGAP